MIPTAYCTVSEANAIVNSDAWNTLVEVEKQNALNWGRVYLDGHYRCSNDYSDLDPVDDVDEINAFKTANALLGDKYANDELFEASATKNRAVAEKQVKAGSVSTRTRYSEPVAAQTYDPFPDVSAVLNQYCSLKSTNFGIHPVIRG